MSTLVGNLPFDINKILTYLVTKGNYFPLICIVKFLNKMFTYCHILFLSQNKVRIQAFYLHSHPRQKGRPKSTSTHISTTRTTLSLVGLLRDVRNIIHVGLVYSLLVHVGPATVGMNVT